MKIYLASKNDDLLNATEEFGKDDPELRSCLCDYFPLLTFRSPGVFQIDLKPLILGEGVYVDSEILGRVMRDKRLPAQLRDFCRELQEEGFLLPIDTQQIITSDRRDLAQLLKTDIDNVRDWLELYRGYKRHMLGLGNPLRLTSTDFSRTFLLFERLFCQVLLQQAERGVSFDNLGPSFVVPKSDVELAPESVAIGSDAIRPLLEYLNLNLILASRLQAEVYDWSILRPAYEMKVKQLTSATSCIAAQTRELHRVFELFFPDLDLVYPSANLRALLKDLSNKKAIKDLREVVQKAAQGDITLDQKFVHTTIRSIFGRQASSEKRNTIISWIVFIGGTLIDVLTHTPVGSIIGKSGEEVAKRLGTRNHWYLLFRSNPDL